MLIPALLACSASGSFLGCDAAGPAAGRPVHAADHLDLGQLGESPLLELSRGSGSRGEPAAAPFALVEAVTARGAPEGSARPRVRQQSGRLVRAEAGWRVGAGGNASRAAEIEILANGAAAFMGRADGAAARDPAALLDSAAAEAKPGDQYVESLETDVFIKSVLTGNFLGSCGLSECQHDGHKVLTGKEGQSRDILMATWRIEKANGEPGEIHFGEKVFIQNRYGTKEYMDTCGKASCGGGYNVVTTARANGVAGDARIWILEGGKGVVRPGTHVHLKSAYKKGTWLDICGTPPKGTCGGGDSVSTTDQGNRREGTSGTWEIQCSAEGCPEHLKDGSEPSEASKSYRRRRRRSARRRRSNGGKNTTTTTTTTSSVVRRSAAGLGAALGRETLLACIALLATSLL
mmetsp:Transcript_41573/g.129324  ORF Transcript_41573/g.129324 Transcript_41573/m.129324 type:complete len:405 (-) Transcript_41573:22-1236(-)